MSRTVQDQFIDDDEEETCPLCVEEFDLSDKGFRPCPCGYQICQFCYHNVRTNMNGLCPACRRPYDDSTIEFRKPNAEEEALWRAKQASRQKKTAVAQQREVLKREADTLNRKHLAGLRVVQKNLVYVTGLSPSVQEDKLLETLRGQQYFGQYGKIIKIVVSKAKDNMASVGVYVTYARKEDAASCIDAVDGSQNGERTLRAQFGTTKYCSAYLRNEQCQNRNCMFLHEPGEDKDSFTRQDLSSMNVASTQQGGSPYGTSQPPPPQSQQPVAAATRPESVPQATAVANEAGPGLPSSASWASRPPPSRSVSRAATAVSASPAISSPTPAPSAVESTHTLPNIRTTSEEQKETAAPPQNTARQRQASSLREPNIFADYISRILSRPWIQPKFNDSLFTDDEKRLIQHMPLLVDPEGGRKRRLMKMKIVEERRRQLVGDQGGSDENDTIPRHSGSLQLGGEPEDEENKTHRRRNSQKNSIDSSLLATENDLAQLSLSNRMGGSQQLRDLAGNAPGNLDGISQPGVFGGDNAQQNMPGHARNVSRFSFANDTSAATSVKPVANSKLMSQQSSMMPPPAGTGPSPFGQQQFFASTVSGPPPGLKTTGTPPVSGGGMFGQGHGFATGGLNYGGNMTNRNANDEMMRELYRRRDLGGQDAGKPIGSLLNSQDPFLDSHLSNASFGFGQRPLQSDHARVSTPAPPGLEGLGHVSLLGVPDQPSRGSRGETGPPGLDGASDTPDKSNSRWTAVPVAIPAISQIVAKVAPAADTAKTPEKAQTTTNEAQLGGKVANIVSPATTNIKDRSAPPNGPVTAPQTPMKSSLAQMGEGQEQKASSPAEKSKAGKPATAAAPQPDPSVPIAENPGNAKASTFIAAATTPGAVASANLKEDAPSSSVQSAQADGARQSAIKMPTKQADTTLKRQAPGKLEMPTNTSNSQAPLNVNPTPAEAAGRTPLSGTPVTSRPGTPASVAETSVKRRAHTIRLVATPKAEAPVSITAVPESVRASRNPSIASMHAPGTPSSDHISDTVSLTSNTISRPASPPASGSRLGSVAVRTKTKSQVKKERQERAKAQEEEVAGGAAEPAEETIHEAVMGRKKKAKKPAAAPKPRAKPETETSKAVEQPDTDETTTTAAAATSQSTTTLAATSPPPAPAPQAPLPPTPPVANAPTLPANPIPSFLSDLRSTSSLLSSCLDAFLRPLAQTNAALKPTTTITPADLHLDRSFRRNPDLGLGPEQMAPLLAREALKYGGEDGRVWSHGCITPSGAHLRHLEQELEERYLALERIRDGVPLPLRYWSGSGSSMSGGAGDVTTELPSVDIGALKAGNGVRQREPNAMEKAVEEGSKKGSFLVGNAEGYVNEFVMPVVPGRMAASSSGAAAAGGVADAQGVEGLARGKSIEEIERLLAEAKRVADEREGQLRKVLKRNRKLAGLGH